MYPKFIELHDTDDGQPISVNIENILMFYPDPDEKGSYISFPFTGTGSYQDVTESYPEVKALIEGCGCLINKADPRLDTSHPLTMDDLQDMVGEPVWNSNLNVWLLVKDVSDLYVDLVWTTGNVSAWDERELTQFPLYRIRTK